jgi:hypothetical protein
MTKKTPIAQRRPFPIEYPRFWESKKTQRAASMGTKKRKISKKPPRRKGPRVPGSKGSRETLQDPNLKFHSRGSDFLPGPWAPWILERYFFRLS